MTEREWDKKLKIHTVGRDDSSADDHHHPYEPTPYCVLERLAESEWLSAENTLVDYGCGKGRVSLFLRHAVGCKSVGLEYDEHIWRQAEENLLHSGMKDSVAFLCQTAEDFVPDSADSFYFFNPFTATILQAVMRRIVASYYEHPRTMRLFFYYPDDAYLSFLLAGSSDGLTDELYFLDEIDCRDLFGKKDERERILVFELGG